ncbi:MAG: hypothetical protein LBS74_00695 [Oscillospiraceae bacterium]|nr:hypothetical protein [Oscillospiraceae bacterium]
MKKSKKLLSVILALVVVVSMASVFAVPAGAVNKGTGYYVATSALNVRTTAGGSEFFSKMKTIPKNYGLSICEISNDGKYGKVSYYSTSAPLNNDNKISMGGTAWVSLESVGRLPAEAILKSGTINGTGVQLRTGAGTSFNSTGISNGATIKYYDYLQNTANNYNWYLVKYNSAWWFVAKNYIK